MGIQEAYEDLFNLRKDAQTLSNDEIKNKLKTLTQGQKSEKVISLMSMTFRALCDLADWSDGNFAGSISAAHGTPVQDQDPPITQQESIKAQQYNYSGGQMNLHYNIQIHLPETTNMAVYDAIFQSLKRHLM